MHKCMRLLTIDSPNSYILVANVSNCFQILIGPYDWGNCQNLPQNSGPGVYELGVGSSTSDLGREIYKLVTDPHRVLAVYIGKSDNVKKILRSYGRDGAHLGDNCSSGSLFNEIFFRGFPIVYRWAAVSTLLACTFIFQFVNNINMVSIEHVLMDPES